MGILKYAVGHHGGGFIGYRVTRTIGSNNDYRQRYFSEKKLGWKEALRQAELQDEEWFKEAKIIRRSKPILELKGTQKTTSKNIIVSGFRAIIITDNRFRRGEFRTYFSPAFEVRKLGTTEMPLYFPIKKLGFRGAYIKAAKKYNELQGLSANSHLALVAKMPDRELFRGFLRQRLVRNGHRLTLKEIDKLLC
jgi:hypothetical protein